MNGPPGVKPIAEPLPGNQAGGRTAPTSKRQALRWLASELGLTGAQAHRLAVAYQQDQRDDARKATREEFSAWFSRRGDLLIVRSKIKRGWAVTS